MPDDDTEIKVLKAQLQTMKDNDKRVLETVRTCAGLLVSMAAILVGYGWFNNKINYERERDNLRRDAETTLREVETKLRAQIDAQQNSMISQVNAAVASLSSNTVSQINLVLDSNRKQFDARIERSFEANSAWIGFEEGSRLIRDKEYGMAAESFAIAGSRYLTLGLEVNALQCLDNVELCVPVMREKNMEKFREYEGAITNLLTKWTARDAQGIYADRFKKLRKSLADATPRR